MIATVRPLAALLAGVAILLTGTGMLGSLLGVRGQMEGFSAQTLGLVMSCYFVGFLGGTYGAPGLIQRIGHIRAFAFFAAAAAASVLLHPILVDPWAWAVLRMATGAALVGWYTVIESWLNAQAPPDQRGQVFAVYMAVNLGAVALGQLVFGHTDPAGFVAFSLVAILVCLATLPVTASDMVQPSFPRTPRMAPTEIFRTAPAAGAGALASGLVMGGFWGLAPVYATELGLGVGEVATMMFAAIAGGALMQWPIGRLSDRGDRRNTLVLVSLVACGLAVALWAHGAGSRPLLYALFFGYGGMVFAINPVCVAHLLDHLPGERILAGGSSLLLVHGAGSALGPAVAGALMQRLGPAALPGFFAAVLVLLAVVAGGRLLLRRRERTQPAHFHPMQSTTPSALEMLPETHVEPGDDQDRPPAGG